VQPDVHSFVDRHRNNPNESNNLTKATGGTPSAIHFLEGYLQLFRVLELYTQPASERPQSRNQDQMTVPAIRRQVSLRQQIVAIRDGFPTA